MSVVDTKHPDRYDTPKEKFALDIEDLGNFKYDMQHCIKCKGCYWVDHTYMPGMKYATRCPENTWKGFDSYGAFGKMRIGLKLLEGGLDWSDHLLEIIYADPMCGACDVGCKRNLDLETGLTLEALRVKAVQDGVAPLPNHKKILDNVTRTGNCYGNTGERQAWAKDLKLPEKADTLYYVGDNTAYGSPEVAKAAAKVMQAMGVEFMILKDEKNTGLDFKAAGDIPGARKLAKEALDQVRATGCKTLVVSDGEVYRSWKAEVPQVLNIATADLGFEVKHIMELAAEAIEDGRLVLKTPFESTLGYHDCCSVSRTCDDWTPYQGERGWMGMVYPRLRRRRGRQGLYEAPRKILNAVPGAQVTEFVRTRENAMCCAISGGVKYNFPELAKFASGNRLEEARDCGIQTIVCGSVECRNNFNRTLAAEGDKSMKAIDITELIAAAL